MRLADLDAVENIVDFECHEFKGIAGAIKDRLRDLKPELTKGEAYAVAEFIDNNIFDVIRNDTEWDSFQNLRNLVHAYEKCCQVSGYLGMTDSAGDPPERPEITLEYAIDFLDSIGWMKDHDKQLYELGLKDGAAKVEKEVGKDE